MPCFPPMLVFIVALLCLQQHLLSVTAQERNAGYLPSPKTTGKIQNIQWANGTQVGSYAVQIGLPPSITATMKWYCDEVGITDLYRQVLMNPEQELKPGTDRTVQLDGVDWYLQRPESKWRSNMHWLSANDEKSHARYMSMLGKGGFDVVLEALGRFFNLDGIDVYSVGFIGVTHCEQGFMHTDFEDVKGKAFNVLIPLQLKEGSRPEFTVENNGVKAKIHYEYDVALAVGDGTLHGTGECDYRDSPGEMRMAMSIYLSDTNEENVEAIIGDYTDPFPPADSEYLLKHRGRHWKKDGSVSLYKDFVLPELQQCKVTADDPGDMTCKDFWSGWDRNQFYDYLKCEEVFSREQPTPDTDTWMLLRRTYEDIVGKEKSSISPLSTDHGFEVKVNVAQSPGRGRSVIADQFISEGTLIWRNRQTARIPDATSYRKLVMALPVDLACSFLRWSYIQNMAEKDQDYDYDEEIPMLSADLDLGALLNNAELKTPEAIEEGLELANMGCIPEAAEQLPGGCRDNYFALNDIQPGEELLCHYGEFALLDPEYWDSFGLVCWGDVC